MSDVELRKQVQERYAAVAVAVTLGRPNNDALSADGCCGSVAAEVSGCCSAGTCAPESVDVGESFGAGLYPMSPPPAESWASIAAPSWLDDSPAPHCRMTWASSHQTASLDLRHRICDSSAT
jgi:hypothetical protein